MEQTYSVYQAQLSDETIDKVNKGEMPAEYKAYSEATFRGDPHRALWTGLYKLVAVIEADSLDEVFEIGNIGPEEKISRKASMRSVSVGDILVRNEYNHTSHNLDAHVVKGVGFQELSRIHGGIYLYHGDL